jgi:protein gp37
MADVFEARHGLDRERGRLWELVTETQWLDWLLLTKRPENVAAMMPWKKRWPSNVWLGATVESQAWAERRMPHLLKCPAHVRFLSCEPLLGPLDLGRWKGRIDWIIAGGESGPGARPMHPAWARGLRDFCESRGIPFHFKQWGHWAPLEMAPEISAARKTAVVDGGSSVELVALGKRVAGRLLDGRTHDEFPVAVAAGAPRIPTRYRCLIFPTFPRKRRIA